jgi:hypothetical protein
MALRPRPADTRGMFRRLAALALWSYFAWYLAATLASFTDAPAAAGPIAAALTAAVAAIGWARAGRRRTRRLGTAPSR